MRESVVAYDLTSTTAKKVYFPGISFYKIAYLEDSKVLLMSDSSRRLFAHSMISEEIYHIELLTSPSRLISVKSSDFFLVIGPHRRTLYIHSLKGLVHKVTFPDSLPLTSIVYSEYFGGFLIPEKLMLIHFSWDKRTNNPACPATSKARKKYSFGNRWCSSNCSEKAVFTKRGYCELNQDLGSLHKKNSVKPSGHLNTRGGEHGKGGSKEENSSSPRSSAVPEKSTKVPISPGKERKSPAGPRTSKKPKPPTESRSSKKPETPAKTPQDSTQMPTTAAIQIIVIILLVWLLIISVCFCYLYKKMNQISQGSRELTDEGDISSLMSTRGGGGSADTSSNWNQDQRRRIEILDATELQNLKNQKKGDDLDLAGGNEKEYGPGHEAHLN